MSQITIIIQDNAVYKDGIAHFNLDLQSCNIPNYVRAFQLQDASGHIEYSNGNINQPITSLPTWVDSCMQLWEAAHQQHLLELAAEQYIPDYMNESFWDEQQYPTGNLSDIAELCNTHNVPGITIEPAYKYLNNTKDLVGVAITSVSKGPTGLQGVHAIVALANQKGIAIFSDRSSQWTSGLQEFLTNNNWIIYTDSNAPKNPYQIAYRTWTLDLAKIKKKRDITLEVISQINNGYDDSTNVWDIDNKSITNMTSRLSVLSESDSITWRSKDNNNIVLSYNEFKTLVTNIVNYINNIYADSWSKKQSVDNAQTIQELANI